MRSDTDHREQLDDFSEFMKQKLEDHRLPVDDLCWEDIELRMKPRGQKWLWWAGSSVAAAVIALLFLFSPFRAGDGSYDGVVPPVASVQDEEKIYQETQENIPEETVPSVNESVPAKKLIAAARPDKPLQITGNEVPETEVAEEIQEQEKTMQQPDVEKSTKDTKEQPEKKQKKQDLYSYESKKYNFSSAGKKKTAESGWSINAGFGTGGHVSLGLGNGDLTMDMDNPSSSITPGNPGEVSPPPVKPPLFENSNVLPPEQYTEVDAALPLSFGVTVRKDFNRYIGVETGLVYTYLSSNLSTWDKVQYKSRLELHYLGIPVNLVVSLWQNPRWKIYLSGGFMMEKGLRSKQTENRFWQFEQVNNVEKKGINGLQWSLNVSAGVSYRFYRDWSFYFEPRISHYFDNDQPPSIRTENSVIIGLGAGIRFDF